MEGVRWSYKEVSRFENQRSRGPGGHHPEEHPLLRGGGAAHPPRRNSENGYRDYGDADIDALQQIKLLRKLGVPLEDIRELKHNEADDARQY